MELDIGGRVAAGDEVDGERTGRQVIDQRAGGRHECLGHQLAAEGAHRIFSRVTAGEDVVAE